MTLIESSVEAIDFSLDLDTFSATYIYDATEWSLSISTLILSGTPAQPTTDIYFMLNKGYTLGDSDAFSSYAQGIRIEQNYTAEFDRNIVPMPAFDFSVDVKTWIVNEVYTSSIALSDIASLDKSLISDVELSSTVPGASIAENQQVRFQRASNVGSFNDKYGVLIGFENITVSRDMTTCTVNLTEQRRVYQTP